ncbi:MAG: 3,4-dihydroxyphenylacetate 2,3-dioxygenase [Deinococcales bacterium]|nr:3,4-dihydroxyphenylacetate 2,3-dioxygenase [Deinococcales bacterium]
MSPVTPANPAPPFAVVRVAHVELGVADLERSRAFYEEALGLVVTEQADGALYLRGLEERSHHSLVLRQEAAGRCLRLGFRVAAEADLERAFAFFAERELAPAWAEAPGQGRTLHVSDPFGQPLALYASQARVERRLQRYGEYRGAAIQRLDHVNLFAAELQATHDFYAGQLGFRTSEYTDTDEAEPRLWAVWMHRKGNVHDVALTNGVGPRLHHVGLWVRGELDVIRACDVLATTGWRGALERGPGRHGISNAFFLYLRDPDGHRVELFTGDYQTLDPDFEPIGWKLDDPQRQTLWGHPAPRSWFEEGSPFVGVEPREPLMPVRPVVAR